MFCNPDFTLQLLREPKHVVGRILKISPQNFHPGYSNINLGIAVKGHCTPI